MNANNNDYGFSTNTDTHMIKNMEWGVVAYLSHSKYGTCTDGKCVEIGLNDDYDLTTGCGSDSSSGCNEYIMGNMVSADGKIMLTGESGFDKYLAEKYYDKYSYGTSDTDLKRGKLGDGIKEVYKGLSGMVHIC